MNKLSNKPLYDQVFDQIKDMIRSGTYCAGDQLPSEKELMQVLLRPAKEREVSSALTGKICWIPES